MDYNLLIERCALKALAKIPKLYRQKIIKVINTLKNNPRPVGAKKLVGRNGWRIRVNSYRIIYVIKEDTATVLVVDIGHRKDIYNH